MKKMGITGGISPVNPHNKRSFEPGWNRRGADTLIQHKEKKGNRGRMNGQVGIHDDGPAREID